MLKKQVSGLTAQKLRLLLLVGIALLIILSATGFWLLHKQLVGFAEQVRATTATAAASTQDLTNLQSLKTKLAEDADTVERTKNIVADSQYYAYQDQIIKDINTYASRAGVIITGYTFNSQTANTTPGASQSAASTPAATTAPQAVPGIKSVSVSVAIKSPVKYSSMMNFIHAIEQNLTKMQLAGVSITKDTQSDNVTANSLNLEVYTR